MRSLRFYFDEWDHDRNRPKASTEETMLDDFRVFIGLAPLPHGDPVDAAAKMLGYAPISTAADLQKVLDAIAFRGTLALVKTRFIVMGGREDAVNFLAHVVISVPERDQGGTVDVSRGIEFRKPVTVSSILYAVRNELYLLFMHEIGEGIMVGGIRPFDPHR